MRLVDILNAECITPELKGKTKEEVIRELISLLLNAGKIGDADKVYKAALDREELMSTGIGHGIAIPHAKSSAVSELVAAFGKSRDGIDFKALDMEPVHCVFLIVAPENIAGPHVKALARVSRLLKDGDFRERLKNMKTSHEILSAIENEEKKYNT